MMRMKRWDELRVEMRREREKEIFNFHFLREHFRRCYVWIVVGIIRLVENIWIVRLKWKSILKENPLFMGISLFDNYFKKNRRASEKQEKDGLVRMKIVDVVDYPFFISTLSVRIGFGFYGSLNLIGNGQRRELRFPFFFFAITRLESSFYSSWSSI